MARPLRIEFAGAIYHVTSRGNARQSIYRDDQDRHGFLANLGEVVERYHLLCHAYCLMNNHYHILVETPDGNLSKAMRQLNGVYTQRFNRSHGRVGHVLQGRFKAILIERESHLLELCRYVVLNPVRAGTVHSAEAYPWSSYRGTAGLEKPEPFLTVEWILGQWGKKRSQARKRYRQFVGEGIRASSPWDELHGGVILGGEAFRRAMEPLLEDKTNVKEVPRAERFSHRPPLGKIVLAGGFQSKGARDRAIREAHMRYGYTLAEIAQAVGVHYTTVSKVVNRK